MAVLSILGTMIAYKSYVLSRDNNDPLAQTCGALADARSSFLEVGAEATTRDGPGRSKGRDQLDRDLRKLTEFANRTNEPAIKVAAINARIAIAQGLNLTPKKPGDEVAYLKTCLVFRFFVESEVIAARCRKENLPSTPKPRGEVDLQPLLSICEDSFVSGM